MKKFKFNLNALEQLYSYGLIDPLDSIFRFMMQEIKKGNTLVLEKQKKMENNSEVFFFHETSELQRYINLFMEKNRPSLAVLLEQRHLKGSIYADYK
jgi:hypothetical protein